MVRKKLFSYNVELKYGLTRNILAQLSLFVSLGWRIVLWDNCFILLYVVAKQLNDLCVSPKSSDLPAWVLRADNPRLRLC